MFRSSTARGYSPSITLLTYPELTPLLPDHPFFSDVPDGVSLTMEDAPDGSGLLIKTGSSVCLWPIVTLRSFLSARSARTDPSIADVTQAVIKLLKSLDRLFPTGEEERWELTLPIEEHWPHGLLIQMCDRPARRSGVFLWRAFLGRCPRRLLNGVLIRKVRGLKRLRRDFLYALRVSSECYNLDPSEPVIGAIRGHLLELLETSWSAPVKGGQEGQIHGVERIEECCTKCAVTAAPPSTKFLKALGIALSSAVKVVGVTPNPDPFKVGKTRLEPNRKIRREVIQALRELQRKLTPDELPAWKIQSICNATKTHIPMKSMKVYLRQMLKAKLVIQLDNRTYVTADFRK